MARTRTGPVHPHHTEHITVKEQENVENIAPAIRRIAKKRVLVGIPESGDDREDDSGIGNAAIGYINEFGSPLQGIHARPHLIPGIEAVLTQVQNGFRRALMEAFEGKFNDDAYLHRIGIVAVNSVHRIITHKIPPPLSQRTVNARRQRSKGSKYRRKAATPAQATPLIDTGNYYRNITHVIADDTEVKVR